MRTAKRRPLRQSRAIIVAVYAHQISSASPIQQRNRSWHEQEDLRKGIGYDRCNVLALTYLTAVPPYVNFFVENFKS
jgi:hypothetical protein